LVPILFLVCCWISVDAVVNKGRNKNTDKAIDEGGPTRHFLSRVWRQLPGLTITRTGSNGQSDSVELFSENCLLTDNEYICYMLKAKDDEPEVEMLVRKTYRIIGRLILYCIAMSDRASLVDVKKDGTSIPVWGHILPNVYRYYYFQNKDPRDLSYELSHLRHDVFQVKTVQGESNKDKMSKYTDSVQLLCSVEDKRIMFREAAYQDLIESRSWAVESIKEGLTLKGLYLFLHLLFIYQLVLYCL
jgi:hypothetical protein